MHHIMLQQWLAAMAGSNGWQQWLAAVKHGMPSKNALLAQTKLEQLRPASQVCVIETQTCAQPTEVSFSL